MYFTSSIGDAIRIPLRLTLFVVSLVLLQPRRRTTHRSCSNDETLNHSRAVPWAPSPDALDLLPLLRQPSQSEHPHRPTQSRWDRHGFAKEVVHLLHLFFTLHVIYIVHWALVVMGNTIILSYYMTSSEVPGNLAIRDGLSWTPSLFISVRLSYAFVDGPGSWASMAVAWVQSNRSSTKTFF